MSFNQEYVDKTGAALLSACPLTSKDRESIAAVIAKIRTYDSELGYPPAEGLVISWAAPFEQTLLKQKEDAESAVRQEHERRKAARQKRIDYLGSADSDRAQAIEEFQARQQKTDAPKPLVPVREYTLSEQNAMSADQYKKLVLGIGADDLPLNESSESAHEEIKDVLRQRTLKRRKNDPLSRALRHEIREGLK